MYDNKNNKLINTFFDQFFNQCLINIDLILNEF